MKAPNAARQARRLIRKGPVRVALAEEKEKNGLGWEKEGLRHYIYLGGGGQLLPKNLG